MCGFNKMKMETPGRIQSTNLKLNKLNEEIVRGRKFFLYFQAHETHLYYTLQKIRQTFPGI